MAWWRAWVLVVVLLVIRIATAIIVERVNPALLRERAKLPFHAGQPWTDKLLLLGVIGTGFFGLPVIAGLDAFHWHLRPQPKPLVAAIGLIAFTVGWIIKALALYANAFATSVVRVQTERRHIVVDTGVYRFVRHPFYAADPFVFVGLGLWLESYATALFAIGPILLVIIRLQLEERFLRRRLPGYDEYARRVPRRLLPGIW
jgi:protein-S-isoprenylcysteine O-methyltransferase Ste14